MRVEELHLKNFCGFKELSVHFPESNLAVFIGNNGAGKTTILKSIVLLLSWLIARIEREKGLGSPISDLDILNGTNFSEIKIKLKNNDEFFEWSLTKTAKGKKKQVDSKLADSLKLATVYRSQFTKDDTLSFPSIIYYPVERSVLDVPLKIRTRHNFSQLDGYDNALSQGVDFRRFFEWFREREDIENEAKSQKFSELLKEIEEDCPPPYESLSEYASSILDIEAYRNFQIKLSMDVHEKIQNTIKDKQLIYVRNAIGKFMLDFENLRIERKHGLKMLVDKKNITTPLNILQLSQGEKSLMALVGDIARRLAMMNPTLENPLEGNGIVLIDEIEMHLHPRWQHSVIDNLRNIFPNCQFIVTTHSPQVLSNIKKEQVFIIEDCELVKITPHTQGRDSNSILYELFGVKERPKFYQDKINAFYDVLGAEKMDEAEKILAELTELFGENDTEVVRAKLHLTFATE